MKVNTPKKQITIKQIHGKQKEKINTIAHFKLKRKHARKCSNQGLLYHRTCKPEKRKNKYNSTF